MGRRLSVWFGYHMREAPGGGVDLAAGAAAGS